MAEDDKQQSWMTAGEPSGLEQNISTSSLEGADTSSLEDDASTTDKIGVIPPTTVNKDSFVQRIIRHTNVYLLLFIFLIVIAGAIVISTYLASKKLNSSTVKTQSLSQGTLNQLANSDVTIGQPTQVLNVQSNAVFAGKVLIRDSLEVAGPIQVGGSINVPGITVSGNSTFSQLQVNKDLSVQGNTSLNGQLSVQKNLSVAGTTTFAGAVSAPSLTVNSLQMSGDLTITKHIITGGPTPSRSTGSALGSGGTVAVSGSDTAGSININTGTSPAVGCFVTVTFNQKYDITPYIEVTPIGPGAAIVNYYVQPTSSSFSVCAMATPPANASFGFDYFIVE